MIIKVNRVKTIEEVTALQKVGVDIIGCTINRFNKRDKPEEKDSKALSLEEAEVLFSKINIPRSCIQVSNYSPNFKKLISACIDRLKPYYLNYFFPTNCNYNKDFIRNSITYLNDLGINVILYGNGFMYDNSFETDIRVFEKLKRLKFIELDSFTISKHSEFKIKSINEWLLDFKKHGMASKRNHFKNDLAFIQHYISDSIKEPISDKLKEVPALIGDELLAEIETQDLEEWNANGITLSISGNENDEFHKSGSLDAITYEFGFNEIIEITKRIKKVSNKY